MTSFSDIIAAAMQVIDDARWKDELAANAAQFYRAKSQTVILAMPLLSKPPELARHLQSGFSDAAFADYDYVSLADSAAGDSVTVQTGKTGFELCSVSMRSADGTRLLPVAAEYDEDSGEVEFLLPASGAAEYTIDFYTDGMFPVLTPTQMRLFALAVAVTWDERFQRDWLANTMKLHDASFDTVNESNYMDKTNARYLANKQAFEDELRDYEQRCAYSTVVNAARHPTLI